MSHYNNIAGLVSKIRNARYGENGQLHTPSTTPKNS
jgi:hypothetical protein